MTTTREMLDALYAIANDPARSGSRARVDVRQRIRIYKAELAEHEPAGDTPGERL